MNSTKLQHVYTNMTNSYIATKFFAMRGTDLVQTKFNSLALDNHMLHFLYTKNGTR